MSLENPIKTIKKAIEGSAEAMASNESLDKPEPKHYDKVFELYKQIRNLNPQLLEKMINISAKGKELKDNLGPELNSIFKMTVDEGHDWFKEKAKIAIEQIEKVENIRPEMLRKEKIRLIHKLIIEMGNRMKNDSNLAIAFKGKEELLDRAINFMTEDLKILINGLLDEDSELD